MWIFFKHLPRGTTTREINRITLKGCRTGFSLASLFKRNIVKRSKIIRIRDLNADSSEYHALVQVDSPVTAEHIIDKLDGKTVDGIFLKPHRYHRRFPSRDRRNHQVGHAKLKERRRGDRRRPNLITRVLEIF
jgi:tRNA U54 and U55 pseudouridine synthase Pus10